MAFKKNGEQQIPDNDIDSFSVENNRFGVFKMQRVKDITCRLQKSFLLLPISWQSGF